MMQAAGGAAAPRPNPAPAAPPSPPASDSAGKTALGRTGLSFATGPTSQTQNQWIDAARTSASPETRAQYDMMVRLSGGRSDNAAIREVMDRYHALGTAQDAASRIAAEKGWFDQLTGALNRFDPVNQLLTLAQPQIAALAKDAGLARTPWGASLQKVLDTPGSIAAFNGGLRAGVLEGAKEMVTGLAAMAGKAVQYGADKGILGDAGDALRSVTGKLPGWLDAIVPSDDRGKASDQALQGIGTAIGGYLTSRAGNPGQIGTDIKHAIGGAWDGLKASHAAAARQGPEAEARWWGETIGRVTFEVASTFVPVAGQAGKVGKGAQAADKLADGVRAADTLADGASAADKAGDAAKAGAVAAASTVRTGGKGANSVTWTLDDQGRLISAKASLKEVFSGLVRSPSETAAQSATAAKGIAGDHGGHAVPHRFLGDQGEINMFPQNGVPDGVKKNFNGSAFKTLENELADWVSSGGRVDYEVKFSNFDPAHPSRPNTVRIEYTVFNKDGVEVYRNRDRFANEAGQTFDRISKSEIIKKLAQ